MNKKTFNKIYLKIDSIAKNGVLGIYDYAKYVDELFTSGQFYILRAVLERKYGILSAQQMTYQQIKDDAYTTIRFNTLSPFQESQKSLMDSLSIYQIGQNVYNGSGLIGSITAQSGLISSDLNQLPSIIGLSAMKVDKTYINISLTTTILDMYNQAYLYLLSVSTTTTTTSTTTTTTTTNNFGSFKFDGITPQYLSILNNSDFFPGTGDFTVEWWQYQYSNDIYPRAWTIGQSPAHFGISVENGDIISWENTNSESFSMNDWQEIWIHLAICRLNGMTTIYQDGQVIGTYQDVNNIEVSSDDLVIGMDTLYPTLSRFDGYITNLHFVIGTALYSDPFDKPTSPITPVSNTKLLLLCNSNNPFMDSSLYDREVTNVSGVAWESFNPFII